MSSSKGSIKFWEYYGTIAGIICNGPVDTLEEVIIDGESTWRGPLHRVPGETFATITLESRRVVRFYWGTDEQVSDPLLQAMGNDLGHDHPPYAGFCYIVLVDFFFGRERTSAPNVEVVVGRKPQQSIFSGEEALLQDKQAAPLATLAEVLCNPRHGLGLDASAHLDAASWDATAVQQYADSAHLNSYLSPLINQQVPLRQAVAEMALNADLWLRYNSASQRIEAGAHPHGTTIDVSALPLLTEHDLTSRPRFGGSGWGDIETGWAITFTDRNRGFKETTDKHDDLRALSIVGDHRRATLKRPWITRRNQALFHLVEYGKGRSQPAVKGQLEVRRAKAMHIRPGNLVRFAFTLAGESAAEDPVPPLPIEWVLFDTTDPRPFLEVQTRVTLNSHDYSNSYPITIAWMPPTWYIFDVATEGLNPYFIRVIGAELSGYFRQALIATFRFASVVQRETIDLRGALYETGGVIDVYGESRVIVRFIDEQGVEQIAVSVQRLDDQDGALLGPLDQTPRQFSLDSFTWAGLDPFNFMVDSTVSFPSEQVLRYASAIGFHSYCRGGYIGPEQMTHLRGLTIRFPGGEVAEPKPEVLGGGRLVEQVFRVVERTIPQTGPIRLSLESEPGISAIAHQSPEDPVQEPQPVAMPEVAHARFFEIPPPLVDGKSACMGVLAERPHDLAIGLNIHYDSDADGTFLGLGIQEIFALRARPVLGWTADALGPLEIEVLSTRDLDLLDDDPGTTAARDNQLLLFAFETDPVTGAIATDTNGFARMEVLSVDSFELTGANTYAVTALRGRAGTVKQDITSANGELWILPSFGIKAFAHADFAQPATTGFFRLQPFSAFGQRPLDECANRSFGFIGSDAYAPQVRFTSPADASLSFSAPPGNVAFAGEVTDADSNLVNFSLLRSSANSGATETLVSLPLAPTGQYTFSRSVAFNQYGNFTLIARAQDSTGKVTDAVVEVAIGSAGGSGTQVEPVSISPNGAFYWNSVSVTLYCPTAGATIETAITDQLTDEAPPDNWSPYAGAIMVSATLRLWARASAPDMTPADPVYADFTNAAY